ncbi:MAG: hypothetical protein FWF53_04465 [Candidatus Azobacteroides sp.]|nr:hypothetical protein [Candidatus Azobacteroides sp.]
MGTIKAIKEKYENAYNQIGGTLSKVVSDNRDVLLDLNRDQLLYGRDAKGEVLTPEYTNDPYFDKFKNPTKAASNYKKMKRASEDFHYGMIRYSGVQLFPNKNDDTPNLIVNGSRFMNHLFINTGSDQYEIGSTGIAADDIQKKYEGYGHPIFGLAPASKKYFYFGWVRPAILKLYKK